MAYSATQIRRLVTWKIKNNYGFTNVEVRELGIKRGNLFRRGYYYTSKLDMYIKPGYDCRGISKE